MARVCSELNIAPALQWESREANTWADALSKGDISGFDPDLEREVPWAELAAIQEDFDSLAEDGDEAS
jgi:hypothetical protein